MEGNNFYIKSGSQDFKARQKDVFDILAGFEAKVNLPMEDLNRKSLDELSRSRAKKNRKATKALRGQESLFKVPGSPPLRPRMPDFRRNPDRWTKYTLADVEAGDMSEATNTAAAMDFLRSRQDHPTAIPQQLPERIEFKASQRRTARARNNDEDETQAVTASNEKKIGFGEVCAPIEEIRVEKPVFVQNKLVMPEYVVGEKLKKPKKNRLSKQQIGKELALSHLLEEED